MFEADRACWDLPDRWVDSNENTNPQNGHRSAQATNAPAKSESASSTRSSCRGVYYDNIRQLWRANWPEETIMLDRVTQNAISIKRSTRTKGFSAKKFGYEKSRQLAMIHRNEMINAGIVRHYVYFDEHLVMSSKKRSGKKLRSGTTATNAANTYSKYDGSMSTLTNSLSKYASQPDNSVVVDTECHSDSNQYSQQIANPQSMYNQSVNGMILNSSNDCSTAYNNYLNYSMSSSSAGKNTPSQKRDYLSESLTSQIPFSNEQKHLYSYPVSNDWCNSDNSLNMFIDNQYHGYYKDTTVPYNDIIEDICQPDNYQNLYYKNFYKQKSQPGFDKVVNYSNNSYNTQDIQKYYYYQSDVVPQQSDWIADTCLDQDGSNYPLYYFPPGKDQSVIQTPEQFMCTKSVKNSPFNDSSQNTASTSNNFTPITESPKTNGGIDLTRSQVSSEL